MTDAISVIGPGWRATNSSGQIITDGVLEFFDAGTSNARTVYSDSSLSTSLGTTVDCNSGGYPVTSGNVRTLIYTGSTAYKVRLTSTIVGGTVWEHDNVLGALDTSGFLTEAAVADQSLVNISTNRSITAADKGKLINVNCSSGALTMTLDDASTLGDGFFVGICHDGTANQVLITGDGSDTFRIPGASVTGFALTGRGQGVWVTCDGTNFKTHSMAPPLIGGTNGVILIADRLSTPAVSPNPGARYIVGSSPTGAWSGFAQHDIAEANGLGGWFNYTPAADCGWIAYVQDENTYYSFQDSAWVELADFATQAEQETGTATNRIVAPGTQHFHPGHPKCWACITVSGGTPTLAASYNITSITDTAQGRVTITIATDFSSADWCALAMVAEADSAGDSDSCLTERASARAAGSVQFQMVEASAEAFVDPGIWSFAGFGDQA